MSCSVDFSRADNHFAYRLYQELTAGGATCQEIDNATGKDGAVSANDVFDFALATENERYQRIVQGVLGHHIPWILNDFDDTTLYDDDIRAQVTERIDALKDILKESGLENGGDEHTEALAAGLYLLLFMPDNSNVIQIREHAFQILADGLHLDKEAPKFSKLKEWLISNGGLGVLRGFEHDIDEEYTALEALHYRLGKCTEFARILYAMMKMAGLSPHLVSIGIGSDAWIANHMSVGVHLAGGLKLLDMEVKHGVSYKVFRTLTPRQALAEYYVNLAATTSVDRDKTKADNYISLALEVDSESSDASFKQSLVLIRHREYVGAQQILDRLVAAYPSNALFHHFRGQVRRLRKDYAGALEDLNKAIALGKEDHGSRHERVHALMGLGRYEEALADITRTIQMKEAFWCDFRIRSTLMLRKGEYRLALADLWKAIRLQPLKAIPALWNSTWSFVWEKLKNVLKGGGSDAGRQDRSGPSGRNTPVPPPPSSQTSAYLYISGPYPYSMNFTGTMVPFAVTVIPAGGLVLGTYSYF